MSIRRIVYPEAKSFATLVAGAKYEFDLVEGKVYLSAPGKYKELVDTFYGFGRDEQAKARKATHLVLFHDRDILVGVNEHTRVQYASRYFTPFTISSEKPHIERIFITTFTETVQIRFVASILPVKVEEPGVSWLSEVFAEYGDGGVYDRYDQILRVRLSKDVCVWGSTLNLTGANPSVETEKEVSPSTDFMGIRRFHAVVISSSGTPYTDYTLKVYTNPAKRGIDRMYYIEGAVPDADGVLDFHVVPGEILTRLFKGNMYVVCKATGGDDTSRATVYIEVWGRRAIY